MPTSHVAVAVRPGEHACCRFARGEDRRSVTAAFIRGGLARGHKVLYLCAGADAADVTAALCATSDEVGPALERGQLEVVGAEARFAADGCFDMERMLAFADEQHTRALAAGFQGLSATGDMSWALDDVAGTEQLAEYEQRLGELHAGETLVMMCQYDQARFATGLLRDMASMHAVDVSPELATIAGVGYLAAARTGAGRMLRLAGELDFGCADALAAVLENHFHGDLHLDLADLRYIDVAGMRALRGHRGQRLTIVGASGAVLRIIGLLGWDTDPTIEVRDAEPVA